MNVGVYLLNSPSHMGGGYTFEQEIITALIANAHECQHSFIIFSHESIGKEIPGGLSRQIKNVVLPKLSIIDNCSRFFMNNFFPASPILRWFYSKISTIETSARKNKIEIMLFCNPIHEPLDIPYITIVWDIQHRFQPWFPEVCGRGEWYARENWFTQILQRATFIIAGTRVGQEEISLCYGISKERIKIIPHPTPKFALNWDKSKNDDNPSEKFGISTNYLLYPAQFWAHKNHGSIISALKIVKEKYRVPLSIVFVGSDKGNLSYIKKMTVDHHLSDEVHFLGFVSRDELVSLYRNAFALLYPTFFGPENLPPLEAFALGCPVIASKVSGSEEQLGDAALFIDPKNPDEIADTIVSLYHNPVMRSSLIEKGYVRATRCTGNDFIRGVISLVNDFENTRKCWDN